MIRRPQYRDKDVLLEQARKEDGTFWYPKFNCGDRVRVTEDFAHDAYERDIRLHLVKITNSRPYPSKVSPLTTNDFSIKDLASHYHNLSPASSYMLSSCSYYPIDKGLEATIAGIGVGGTVDMEEKMYIYEIDSVGNPRYLIPEKYLEAVEDIS